MKPLPRQKILGFTFDDAYRWPKILPWIEKINYSNKWIRLIYDEEMPIDDLVKPVKILSQFCNILLEVIDSEFVSKISEKAYEERLTSACMLLGPYITAMEVMNEVSGDWLGSDASVSAKMKFGVEYCRKLKINTAITYYLSGDDSERMHYFMARYNYGEDLKLISWYPNWTPKTKVIWYKEVERVCEDYHYQMVGIGEFGYEPKTPRFGSGLRQDNLFEFLMDHYNPRIPAKNFINGGFYWDTSIHGLRNAQGSFLKAVNQTISNFKVKQ